MTEGTKGAEVRAHELKIGSPGSLIGNEAPCGNSVVVGSACTVLIGWSFDLFASIL